ncbi:hypothetical protein HY04_10460 [Kaistella antarctica]|uniref:Uncharacterized protein n=1 Tax=Kaistella antarctica TaxID=266748 RepID=A0ABR4TYC6_9FLAO|nr:hypothetical protein HY04_10460 [Kaistella antarctica]
MFSIIFFEASTGCFFYFSVPLSVAICPCNWSSVINLNFSIRKARIYTTIGAITSVFIPLENFPALLELEALTALISFNRFRLKPMEFSFFPNGLKPVPIDFKTCS